MGPERAGGRAPLRGAAGPCWALPPQEALLDASEPDPGWWPRLEAPSSTPAVQGSDRVGWGHARAQARPLPRGHLREQPGAAMGATEPPRLQSPGAAGSGRCAVHRPLLAAGAELPRRRAAQRLAGPLVGAPAGLPGAPPAPGRRAAPGADLPGRARAGGRPARVSLDPAGPGAALAFGVAWPAGSAELVCAQKERLPGPTGSMHQQLDLWARQAAAIRAGGLHLACEIGNLRDVDHAELSPRADRVAACVHSDDGTAYLLPVTGTPHDLASQLTAEPSGQALAPPGTGPVRLLQLQWCSSGQHVVLVSRMRGSTCQALRVCTFEGTRSALSSSPWRLGSASPPCTSQTMQPLCSSPCAARSLAGAGLWQAQPGVA